MVNVIKITKEQTLSKEFEVLLDSEETVKQAFAKQHWDIPALLQVLNLYIERDLKCGDNKLFRIPRLLELRDACRGWSIEGKEIKQYDGQTKI